MLLVIVVYLLLCLTYKLNFITDVYIWGGGGGGTVPAGFGSVVISGIHWSSWNHTNTWGPPFQRRIIYSYDFGCNSFKNISEIIFP